MDEKMFCFQCEQTAKCTACTGRAGVCGKPFDVALAQDELTGALVGLACTCKQAGTRSELADKLIVSGLFTCITNVNFSKETVDAITADVRAEKERIAAAAGIEAAQDLLLGHVWSDNEDVRSLKSLILFGLRGAAAYAYHARMLGSVSDEAQRSQHWRLRHAHPSPPRSRSRSRRGLHRHFRHDLHDLSLLLGADRGTGVNVYTHGGCCPPTPIPSSSAIRSSWATLAPHGRISRRFANVPAAFVFTTNCLMPPRPSYADRVFTTEVVRYPGSVHIRGCRWLEGLHPGHREGQELVADEDVQLTGINGGTKVVTGFARAAVLSVADKVVDAVKAGKIKHFFLVGGCDGAKPGRNYYTELVKQAPKDTVILTLACGKYRFNDLDLGDIDGIPRLLDIGQCNDAHTAPPRLPWLLRTPLTAV